MKMHIWKIIYVGTNTLKLAVRDTNMFIFLVSFFFQIYAETNFLQLSCSTENASRSIKLFSMSMWHNS